MTTYFLDLLSDTQTLSISETGTLTEDFSLKRLLSSSIRIPFFMLIELTDAKANTKKEQATTAYATKTVTPKGFFSVPLISVLRCHLNSE